MNKEPWNNMKQVFEITLSVPLEPGKPFTSKFVKRWMKDLLELNNGEENKVLSVREVKRRKKQRKTKKN